MSKELKPGKEQKPEVDLFHVILSNEFAGGDSGAFDATVSAATFTEAVAKAARLLAKDAGITDTEEVADVVRDCIAAYEGDGPSISIQRTSELIQYHLTEWMGKKLAMKKRDVINLSALEQVLTENRDRILAKK